MKNKRTHFKTFCHSIQVFRFTATTWCVCDTSQFVLCLVKYLITVVFDFNRIGWNCRRDNCLKCSHTLISSTSTIVEWPKKKKPNVERTTCFFFLQRVSSKANFFISFFFFLPLFIQMSRDKFFFFLLSFRSFAHSFVRYFNGFTWNLYVRMVQMYFWSVNNNIVDGDTDVHLFSSHRYAKCENQRRRVALFFHMRLRSIRFASLFIYFISLFFLLGQANRMTTRISNDILWLGHFDWCVFSVRV